jgi:hypothetical protein
MSPFGHKDNDDKQARMEQWRQEIQAELARLETLPIAQLASEVMTKGFGPGGPGADDSNVTVGQANISAGQTAADIAGASVADRGFIFPLPTEDDMKVQGQIARLIAEGLQELEHRSLVRAQMHTSMGGLDFATTRHGRAALEHGEVDAILAGESAQPAAT